MDKKEFMRNLTERESDIIVVTIYSKDIVVVMFKMNILSVEENENEIVIHDDYNNFISLNTQNIRKGFDEDSGQDYFVFGDNDYKVDVIFPYNTRQN